MTVAEFESLGSSNVRMRGLVRVANLLIYASVVLGVALLAQLYYVAPLWLLLSILVGWIAYLIVAIAVAMRIAAAYPVSLVLAALTLAVSIPQPGHYSFGMSIASVTFVAGSVLQIGVILSVTGYLLIRRRTRRDS